MKIETQFSLNSTSESLNLVKPCSLCGPVYTPSFVRIGMHVYRNEVINMQQLSVLICTTQE